MNGVEVDKKLHHPKESNRRQTRRRAISILCEWTSGTREKTDTQWLLSQKKAIIFRFNSFIEHLGTGKIQEEKIAQKLKDKCNVELITL